MAGQGAMYLDEDMAFYKALGGGKVVKKGLMALGSKAVRNNNKRSKEYLASIGGTSNLKGEGMIMGGMYVIAAAGGGIVLQKNEETFGDISPVDAIMEATIVILMYTHSS